VAPHVGSVAYIGQDRTELIALFANVRNQGDAWTYTLNHLERFLGDLLADGDQLAAPHELYNSQMHTLGRRVGQMHALLSAEQLDPVFTPEPIEQADLSRWSGYAEAHLGAILQSIAQRLPTMNEHGRVHAQRLLEMRERAFERILQLARVHVDAVKIRHHGNLHLGKVLLAADDFLITGFEGDASLPLQARRRKECALRDIASLLNSLDYARVAALERAIVARPEQRERLTVPLASWFESASAALFAGYRFGVRAARCVPSNELDMRRLIRLFRISRALQEAENELNGRTGWTGVPLEVLLKEIERDD